MRTGEVVVVLVVIGEKLLWWVTGGLVQMGVVCVHPGVIWSGS